MMSFVECYEEVPVPRSGYDIGDRSLTVWKDPRDIALLRRVLAMPQERQVDLAKRWQAGGHARDIWRQLAIVRKQHNIARTNLGHCKAQIPKLEIRLKAADEELLHINDDLADSFAQLETMMELP